jgi:enoyl-CoA hydratase/carnithine racemase
LAGGVKRNALGRSTIERIESLVMVPPVGTRAVVLTAEGPDFSAGYDLHEAARGNASELIAHSDNFAPLRRARVPVIAALHGRVIGGGLELALAADIRLAAPDTTLGLPAGRLGLVYSEEGTRLLVSEVGESRARAMLLGGRVISADEAAMAGIVTEVVPLDRLDERVLELASTIASWSPVATSGNRRLLDAVVGRSQEDMAELRLASFAPDGDLVAGIAEFAQRRHAGADGQASWGRLIRQHLRSRDAIGGQGRKPVPELVSGGGSGWPHRIDGIEG